MPMRACVGAGCDGFPGNNNIRCVPNNGACAISFSYTDNNGATRTFSGNFAAGSNTLTNAQLSVPGGGGGAGPTASQRTQTVTSLQNSFNSVTPSVLGTDGLGINSNGLGVNGNGVNFTPSGLSFNRSSIDSSNPLDRDYGAAFTDKGYFARHGQSRHRNNGFNFSMNLQQMAVNAKRKEAEQDSKLGIHRSGSKDGSYQPQSRWVSSLSGRYVEFDDDEVNADRDGSLWYVTSALGYRVSDRTTAGVFTRYRDGEVDSTALASSLDSELWGGGVYLATASGGGLRFVGAALFEHGENDITISGATGDFDSETITLEATLDKRISRGRTWIEPQVSLLYHKSDNDDFTDSAGNFVIGDTNVLGRVSFGPRIGTSLGGNGRAQIKPFAKINGVWDFEREDTVTASTGGLLKTGEHAISLGGGVDITLVNGLALRIAGDWFTYDTELEGWSISGGIGGSFAAFGLAGLPPGFVSLDLAANADDASAMGRIRIPFGGGERSP
jgi:outer membrane autotransporter protein